MLSYRRCRLAFVAVIDRLDAIEAEFVELEASLGSAEVLGDQSRLREASRRYKQLTPLVECIREYKMTAGNIEAARELLEISTGDEHDLMKEEIQDGEQKAEKRQIFSHEISSTCIWRMQQTKTGRPKFCQWTSQIWAASIR